MIELEMIPVIVFSSIATEGKWMLRSEPHLLDVENTEEDVMTMNIYGPKWDYQIQIKTSALIQLMKEKEILGDSE